MEDPLLPGEVGQGRVPGKTKCDEGDLCQSKPIEMSSCLMRMLNERNMSRDYLVLWILVATVPADNEAKPIGA